jgi:hypothetical protein
MRFVLFVDRSSAMARLNAAFNGHRLSSGYAVIALK